MPDSVTYEQCIVQRRRRPIPRAENCLVFGRHQRHPGHAGCAVQALIRRNGSNIGKVKASPFQKDCGALLALSRLDFVSMISVHCASIQNFESDEKSEFWTAIYSYMFWFRSLGPNCWNGTTVEKRGPTFHASVAVRGPGPTIRPACCT